MDRKEADLYVGKKVRILLSNNFHYTGFVIRVSSDMMVIKDKFDMIVLIRLSDILIFEEVQNDKNN